MKNDADKRWKKRIKPLWLLFSFLILVPALYFSLIPVDITRYTPQIKSSIESRINGTIDMERIELRILPYPKMKIKGFKLSDRKETVIKARAVNASVMLFPLFFKRIDVKNLEINGADIIVRRDKEGEINLRKIPLEKWSIISLKKLRLRDARVVFADEMTEKPSFLEMDNVKAYFNQTSSGAAYTATGRLLPDTPFYVSGEAREDGEKTELSGTLSVDNLKIKEVSRYVKKEDLRGVTVDGKMGAKLVYSLS
ncbi:MAG TPA: AsmA family protein, partial [Thermodesulfobacteriota bacterium]|nr:AsmA family protein [Thermodesulfobacteriota bacterium]